MTLWVMTAELMKEVESHNKLYHPAMETVPMRTTQRGKLRCKVCTGWQSQLHMEPSLKNILSDKELEELVGDL